MAGLSGWSVSTGCQKALSAVRTMGLLPATASVTGWGESAPLDGTEADATRCWSDGDKYTVTRRVTVSQDARSALDPGDLPVGDRVWHPEPSKPTETSTAPKPGAWPPRRCRIPGSSKPRHGMKMPAHRFKQRQVPA